MWIDVEVLQKKPILLKELARTVAGYTEVIRQVKWQEVRSALKPNDAAIEFVHFKVNFPKTTDNTVYAALLLLPGAEQPRFIPSLRKNNDSLLLRNSDRNEPGVKQLYSLANRGVIVVDKPRKTLYNILWQPLERDDRCKYDLLCALWIASPPQSGSHSHHNQIPS
ncbi:MAG: hypothetical protein IPH31_18220 [Lewinellaceae bacterium]|nr:hypothetical protein [Lewinellaceae bacterium]